MRNPILAFLVLAAATAPSRAETVYGRDGRREAAAVRAQKAAAWVGATAALFKASSLSEEGEGFRIALAGHDGGGGLQLCEGTPFRGQGAAAFCSGVLVAPDLLLTAGHCIGSSRDCSRTLLAFGFTAGDDGRSPERLPKDAVFACKELLAMKLEHRGADYALVRLDRPAEGRVPAALRRSGRAPVGTPLTVLGHPDGLPLKVAGGASVREADRGGFLVADLDTFGGNSGGPVFNSVTGQLEGLLVRGGRDYERADGCLRVVVEMNDTGRGEDVTLVSKILSDLEAEEPTRALLSAGRLGAARKSVSEAVAASSLGRGR